MGLNHEYQLHKKELEKLKQFCEMDRKKAVDFNFRLFKPTADNNPILLCEYEPKYNKVQNLIMSDKRKVDIRI